MVSDVLSSIKSQRVCEFFCSASATVSLNPPVARILKTLGLPVKNDIFTNFQRNLLVYFKYQRVLRKINWHLTGRIFYDFVTSLKKPGFFMVQLWRTHWKRQTEKSCVSRIFDLRKISAGGSLHIAPVLVIVFAHHPFPLWFCTFSLGWPGSENRRKTTT